MTAFFERTKREWKVKIQADDAGQGKVIEEPVHAYWSPTFDGVKESVARAALGQAFQRHKGKVNFTVIGEPELAS